MQAARKGILLAGGANSRLYPSTHAVAKSLLPIYDKPLIYYSLALAMLAGVREVLVITTPESQSPHQRLLGDGAQFGISIAYAVQEKPRGIADAFLIGREFLAGAPSMLVLSDNIFFGQHLPQLLQQASERAHGATVFARQVANPEDFGVVEFDDDGKALSLEEKPKQPKSSHAVPGCYFYDDKVCDHTAALQPSARGELEITDLNRIYLEKGELHVKQMGRGTAWFDTGTPDSMADAWDFVRVVQKQQGLMISCPEEIAWRQEWLDDTGLRAQAERLRNTPYGAYLRKLLQP